MLHQGRRRPDGKRKAWFALWALLVASLFSPVMIGMEPAQASGLIVDSLPLPPTIGKTDAEVREGWGEPRYIKVAPHDGDRRYAYFTLREWEQLGMLYPATQGEDVYVVQDAPMQVHIRYQPLFSSQDRFNPVFRVTMVTYVFDEPTPLARVAELLPRGEDGQRLNQATWYRPVSGGDRTVLAHWAAYEHPAARAVVPFRADPPVTYFWEVGLSVPSESVSDQTPVNYVIERLDQLPYSRQELEAMPNPYAD